jgi:pilus assembly protein CpaB
MDSTSKKLLLLALVLALAAGLGVYYFFAGLERKALVEHTEEVVVATVNIPARTTVRGPMVTVVRVPRGSRHLSATDSLGNVIGRVTTAPIIAGEQVLLARLHGSGQDSGLAFELAAGYRALSVHINERIAVAYLVRPGDSVDVTVSYEPATPQGEHQSVIMLQNILVVAIGSETRHGAPAPTDAKTITLAVTPEQAERLVWAEDHGSIRLLLRPVTDNRHITTSGANARTVAGPR